MDIIKPISWDKHQLYKNFWGDLPSFVEVLSDLETNLKQPNSSQHIGDMGFVTWKGERIPRIAEMLSDIQALRPDDVCTAHIYISVVSFSKTFGRHEDFSDVFYIQGEGKTDWLIEDAGQTHHYVLEKGDMVYVPNRMFHTPTPLSPRYGISIGFDTHTQRQ